jgi:hypothetical protein
MECLLNSFWLEGNVGDELIANDGWTAFEIADPLAVQIDANDRQFQIHDISRLVESLCDLSLAGEYGAVRKRVLIAAQRCARGVDSIEAVCEARLSIQSDLIEQHPIRSIIEDRHQKLGVEYFCLDRHLLDLWFNKPTSSG